MQSAAGSFPLEGELEKKILRLFESNLLSEISHLIRSARDDREVIGKATGDNEIKHTLISVFLIKKLFPGSRRVWELMVEKAEIWVSQKVPNVKTRLQLWDLVSNAWEYKYRQDLKGIMDMNASRSLKKKVKGLVSKAPETHDKVNSPDTGEEVSDENTDEDDMREAGV
jgi:hypothetical protein